MAQIRTRIWIRTRNWNFSKVGSGSRINSSGCTPLQPMVPVDGVSAGTGGEDDQGPVAPAPLLTGNTAHSSIYEKSNSLDRKKRWLKERCKLFT
jgi:hypothetical protein